MKKPKRILCAVLALLMLLGAAAAVSVRPAYATKTEAELEEEQRKAAQVAALEQKKKEQQVKLKELEKQIVEMQQTIDDLQKQLDVAKAGETKKVSEVSKDEYGMGETWTVDGQWKLTVLSVEETQERNEYSDKNPVAVYLVTYEYEDLGYEEEGWNGLYLSMEDGIVDTAGKMGYDYPGDVTDYPQETPVGATCTAQACIGVENAGDFKIHFSTYDGNGKEQKAVFAVKVDGEN